MNRIKFLDGFRGLAILWVVSYHAYARWPEIFPYKDKFEHIALLNNGWLGVQLFFLISGFVILMTLEKCKNFNDFIVKRWIRLFPAMLIATILIFFSAPLLPERPLGVPVPKDTIAGLFFIEPRWVYAVFNVQPGLLEGAFWSLLVEVKYYIIFGLLYFYKGEMKAIVAISVLFVMAVVLMSLAKVAPQIPYITQAGALMSALSLRHFGWFAAGSLMYLYTLKHDKKLIGYALAVGCLSAVSVMLGKSPIVLLFSLAVLAIFVAAVYFDNFKKVFENKILLYVGFISYPMYLIHENAMIALIVKLNHYTNGAIPDFLLPIMPILFLMGVAHLITQYFEPLVRNTLKRLLPI